MSVLQYALSVATIAMLVVSPSVRVGFAQKAAEETKPMDEDKGKEIDFKHLKSPVPYTKKSIRRGHTIFKRRCVECHGPDGKSQIDVIADATDLTEPEYYYNGSTEGEVFGSIRDGSGTTMPPYKDEIRRTSDIWHLVNFIRSLWPKEARPKLQDDADETDAENAADAEPKGPEDDG